MMKWSILQHTVHTYNTQHTYNYNTGLLLCTSTLFSFFSFFFLFPAACILFAQYSVLRFNGLLVQIHFPSGLIKYCEIRSSKVTKNGCFYLTDTWARSCVSVEDTSRPGLWVFFYPISSIEAKKPNECPNFSCPMKRPSAIFIPLQHSEASGVAKCGSSRH